MSARHCGLRLLGLGGFMASKNDPICPGDIQEVKPYREGRSCAPRISRKIAMTTEKQIAANRTNSKRSTGPKTKLGRLKSGRNALRHGLSCPLSANIRELDSIAQIMLMAENEEQLVAAREFARAELELRRVRHVRSQIIASLFQSCDPCQLRRLVALDRYERSARAKRKRAQTRSSPDLRQSES
jgi:hypothetical protein